MFDWRCHQACIAPANMMTAAAMIGIGPCPIEGFSHDNAEAVRNEAGLREGGRFGLAVMVAFGYRANRQPAKTRQALDVVRRIWGFARRPVSARTRGFRNAPRAASARR